MSTLINDITIECKDIRGCSSRISKCKIGCNGQYSKVLPKYMLYNQRNLISRFLHMEVYNRHETRNTLQSQIFGHLACIK